MNDPLGKLFPVWIAIGYCLAIYSRSAPAAEPFASQPQPTGSEQKIRTALAEKTELHLDDLPLADFAALVKRRHGIEVQFDQKALIDYGIGWDTPLTCDLQGISLRSALRLLLSGLDLTYVVRNETLLVTTKTEAENIEVVRIYPVEDLVIAFDEFVPGARRPDPGENPRQFADVQSLIVLMTSVADPTSWDEGNAVMGQFHDLLDGRCLAIRQMQDVHEQIEELLASLRAVRDVQRKWGTLIAKQTPRKEPQDRDALTLRAYAFQHPEIAAYLLLGDPSPLITGTDDPNWLPRLARQISEGIEPRSWQAAGGPGAIAAVGNLLLVRQTAENQRHVADVLQGFATSHSFVRPRLAPEGPRLDWPQQAEPRPFGIEAKIEQALEDVARIDFTDEPLSEIARWLEQRYAIEVELDRRALLDGRIVPETPLTLHGDGASLRSALKRMLAEAALTFDVRNEALIITTETEAECLLATKVYPVLDLAVRRADDGPSRDGASRPMLDYQSLVEMIVNSIPPSSWDCGGPGAIQAYPNCGALVISQTGDIHRQIAAMLDSLRRAGTESNADKRR